MDSLRTLCLSSLVAVAASSAMLCQSTAAGDIVFTEADEIAELPDDVIGGASTHNSGVCWIDVNNDDNPDLFVSNGFELAVHLYLNDGDGTFTARDDLLPPLDSSFETSGAVFADIDNDGDQDLYIQNSHEDFLFGELNEPSGPSNWLLRNLWMESGEQFPNKGPLFELVSSAAENLADPPLGKYDGYRTLTGGFIDYDRDGLVDLFCGTMRPESGGDPTNGDFLYRNLGDGVFIDTSVESGILDLQNPETLRCALAWGSADVNGDGWPDMYVVNAHDPTPYHWDQMYINNGDGTFTDVFPDQPGLGDDSGSGMGVDFGDIDNDGDFDIYVTDVPFSAHDASDGNVLYVNNGDGTFTDNVAPERGCMGNFSWGCNFCDFDHDGWIDLLVGLAAQQGPPILYRNNGDGTFTDISEAAGFTESMNIRGTAVADYDSDGDMDIVMTRYNAPGLELFRNDSTNTGNWLQFKLVGVESNRSAIGAEVRVVAGELQMMRSIKGGASAHSQDQLPLHFGVADADTVFVEIRWPSGKVECFEEVAANQVVTFTEGETAVCPADLDGDGIVGAPDLIALLGAWGPNPGDPADFDGDDIVGTTDLLGLLGAWGPCPK